ncbi:ketose-bisphosphate aldolase [Microbacterium sp. 5K110]|jgi:fructose-bisphosphate aldolase class II|uniref:ketose-bisphosphate aldolase n=1 Tax=unclassified Microbacterium TaxID=2609290 RepID=UPI0010FD61D0|nr:ketose-bisphosphate aldolase [Microbacterium sp. 5K110]TLF31054.1 ketose-bisphosphate aldolase [Microbacterium sp. 5K110]
MLITGDQLLAVANDHNFAIPAFNIAEYNMFNAIMEICEQKQAPFIAQIHPNEINLLTFDIVQAMRSRIHRSPLPVIIHWDHGASHSQIAAAIQGGFTSVMIDKSMEPFDVNVEITRRVVDTAHAVNVSVEGELGTIGSMDHATTGDGIVYTDPSDALTFVEETGVDSLAIAIGTRHGIYPAGVTPRLDLDRLRRIKEAVGIPLVLHGGSNNPDDEIAEAARSGVNKINISSDLKSAYHNALRNVLRDESLYEPDAIQPPAMNALKDVVAHKLDLLGTTGKAELYRQPASREIDLFGLVGQTLTV